MDTLMKLQEALDLMKQAEKLVGEARRENKSLNEYHGYSLQIIEQELNKFTDNSRGFLTRDTALADIIAMQEEREWREK